MSKNLKHLRKISATAWTDGHEIFYFTVVDSAGNVTVQGLTVLDLTANMIVATNASKKLVSFDLDAYAEELEAHSYFMGIGMQ